MKRVDLIRNYKLDKLRSAPELFPEAFDERQRLSAAAAYSYVEDQLVALAEAKDLCITELILLEGGWADVCAQIFMGWRVGGDHHPKHGFRLPKELNNLAVWVRSIPWMRGVSVDDVLGAGSFAGYQPTVSAITWKDERPKRAFLSKTELKRRAIEGDQGGAFLGLTSDAAALEPFDCDLGVTEADLTARDAWLCLSQNGAFASRSGNRRHHKTAWRFIEAHKRLEGAAIVPPKKPLPVGPVEGSAIVADHEARELIQRRGTNVQLVAQQGEAK